MPIFTPKSDSLPVNVTRALAPRLSRHVLLLHPIDFPREIDQSGFDSAGFDAADGDPLGGCNVTPRGYAQMTNLLRNLAGGKMVVALEGGYNLR